MNKKILCIFLALVPVFANADLVALDDAVLANATGEGLGIVLEDFVFNVDDAVTSVTGIKSSSPDGGTTDGRDVTVDWTEFYIMGEGSQNGTIETPGQIGSLAYPWVLETLPGNAFASIGDDIALLQLRSGEYTYAMENTDKYAKWARYQECVYGQSGCTNANDAVVAMDSIISRLTSEKDALEAFYNGQMVDLESGINNDIATVIVPQQQIVTTEQTQMTQAYDTMETAWIASGEGVPLGQKYEDCGWLGSSECTSGTKGDYNSTVDVYLQEVTDYNEAERTLAELYQNTNDANGNSLIKRLQDYESYRSLCGEVEAGNSCADGLVAVRQNDRDDINDVAIQLNAGYSRRAGLDIGSKFKFTVYDENKGAYREDFMDIDMKGVTLDGSYIKLWSRDNKLNAEFRLNLYAKELNIGTCGSACNTQLLQDSSTLFMDNFYLSLSLGYGEVQPLMFSVTSDGNFQLDLSGVDGTNYNDFYDNAAKSYLYVGNIQLGNATAVENSLGSLTVDGLRATYLKVTSHDL
ncbi:hypothetical protein CN03_02170 [Thalassolituus oleivorans]|uniref:hypothetical protein n=1 Tax=Thalassolituus oleivorans TaxID=187493 RepID=UPI0009492392|nr:hypothetical protein [Thalassolituus oleivorans]APR65830.1 hypothetical protein CN03_02170 [Thalassolituus oleivorans]